MLELSARVAAPGIVRTHGNGNDPRQAAMGLFYGRQTAEPFTLPEAITVYYDPGTGLVGDLIPALTQARLWQGDQASSDTADLVLLDNLHTFYKIFTLPASLQLYAVPQQDYPAITETTIPLWDVSGRHWRRAQLRPVDGEWMIQLLAGSGVGAYDSGLVDGPLGTNRLYGPMGMAVYPGNLLYIADGIAQAPGVRVLDLSTGLVSSLAPDVFFNAFIPDEQIGLTSDSEGVTIWYSGAIGGDTTAVGLFGMAGPDGVFDLTLGGSSSAPPTIPMPTPELAANKPFPRPNQICMSPDDARVYFTDGGNSGSTVYYYQVSDKTLYTLADTGHAGIQGVTCDAAGNVYAVAASDGAAFRITPDGLTLTQLTDAGTGPGFGGDGSPALTGGTDPQFDTPSSIAYDPVTGTIAILDAGNNAVRAISGGTLSTIAGTPGTGLGTYPTATPVLGTSVQLGATLNQLLPAPGGGFFISVGNQIRDQELLPDGMYAIYLLKKV